MSILVLIIIGCVTLFMSHLPFAIPTLSIAHGLSCVGKVSFPILAFIVANNYMEKPSSFSKSFVRLIVFGLVAQVFSTLLIFGKVIYLYFNIFFTLALGLLSIRFIDKFNNKVLAGIIVTLIAVLAEVLKFDYGCVGVLLVVTFMVLQPKKAYKMLIQIVLIFILYLRKAHTYIFTIANFRYLLFQILFSIVGLVFPIFYNKEKNKESDVKTSQLLFYAFYPLQLIILFVLSILA